MHSLRGGVSERCAISIGKRHGLAGKLGINLDRLRNWFGNSLLDVRLSSLVHNSIL